MKKGKDQRYCWNDEERDAHIADMGKGKDSSVGIQRYKGLGEMNASSCGIRLCNLKTEHLDK